MLETTAYVRTKNRAKVRRDLRRINAILARGALGEGFRNGLAFGALSKIGENFAENSKPGGSPEVDMNWPPLSPRTIQKRLHGTDYRSRMTQQAKTKHLSAAQKKDMRKRITRRKNELIEAGLDPGSALGLARANVYGEFRRGGSTIPTNRELTPILRDTGIGFNALTPVAFDPDSGAYQGPRPGTHRETGQEVDPIQDIGPGEVSVGVRGYMARHHTGAGKRLPKRPLWPEPDQWPKEWWEHLQDVNNQLMIHAAVMIARGHA